MLLFVFLILVLVNINMSICRDNWFQNLLIKVTIQKLTDEPVCITGQKGPCKDSPDGQRIMNGCHGNKTTFVIKSVGEVGHANMTRVQDAHCPGCCPGILTPCSRIWRCVSMYHLEGQRRSNEPLADPY